MPFWCSLLNHLCVRESIQVGLWYGVDGTFQSCLVLGKRGLLIHWVKGAEQIVSYAKICR